MALRRISLFGPILLTWLASIPLATYKLLTISLFGLAPITPHSFEELKLFEEAGARLPILWWASCKTNLFTLRDELLEITVLADCHRLNQLEIEADLLNNLTEPGFQKYEMAMRSWRSKHLPEQPTCRTDVLGAQLCHEADMDPSACSCYHLETLNRYLNPAHFWFEEFNMFTELRHEAWYFDEDYVNVYAGAGHLAPPYGPAQTPWHVFRQGEFRKKRIQNLQPLRLLSRAAAMRLSHIKQIVEFGTGTGDVAAMLLDMNYTNTLLIYDFPWYIPVVRYWHRYSGVPSILGHRLLPTPDIVRGRIILESDYDHLSSHIDTSSLNESLFLATYSFGETNLETKLQFAPLIRTFGFIIMTFADNYGPGSYCSVCPVSSGNDVVNVLFEALNDTHVMKAWRTFPYHPGEHYHFVAFLKSHRGEVMCAPELNCRPDTLHPRFQELVGPSGEVHQPA